MMRKNFAVALVGVLAFTMVAATAADARRKPVVKAVAAKVAPAFKAADANSSRQLDTSEWSSAGYDTSAFTRADLNANGTVGYLEVLLATLAKLKAGRSQ